MKGSKPTDNFSMGRIVKRASGWYFQYGTEVKEKKPIKKIKSAIGIDVGLKSFLVDSNRKEAIAEKRKFNYWQKRTSTSPIKEKTGCISCQENMLINMI